MTCRQMGGPCDTQIHGATAEEMLNNGTAHVMASSDEDHQKVLAQMNAMMQDPQASEGWNREFEAKFAALPEE